MDAGLTVMHHSRIDARPATPKKNTASPSARLAHPLIVIH
jgi:hypothetical protein